MPTFYLTAPTAINLPADGGRVALSTQCFLHRDDSAVPNALTVPAGEQYVFVMNDPGTATATAPDVTPPTISSTVPVDNATNVAIGSSITITFSEPIAFGSGLITLRTNDGGWADAETFDVATDVGAGDGQVSISGAVLTINPTGNLANEREYAIRIAATAIDDLAGNSFAGVANDTTLSFTTAAAAGVDIATIDAIATSAIASGPGGFYYASGFDQFRTTAGGPTGTTPPAANGDQILRWLPRVGTAGLDLFHDTSNGGWQVSLTDKGVVTAAAAGTLPNCAGYFDFAASPTNRTDMVELYICLAFKMQSNGATPTPAVQSPVIFFDNNSSTGSWLVRAEPGNANALGNIGGNVYLNNDGTDYRLGTRGAFFAELTLGDWILIEAVVDISANADFDTRFQFCAANQSAMGTVVALPNAALNATQKGQIRTFVAAEHGITLP